MATMIDNLTLGSRLKACRVESGLTLKAMEAIAGVSATHISEIERGKTSPTIGALQKLATALERDLTYFLEAEALDEVAHQRPFEREWVATEGRTGRWMNLSARIPGTRLSTFRIELQPDHSFTSAQDNEADDVFLVESGRVVFEVGETTFELEPGDSIHLRGETAYRYVNGGSTEASMFQFSAYRRTMPVMPAS